MRPLQKGIFLPPALFANAHLLLNKLRFDAELKNKNLRFLHAVSSYAKLSQYLRLNARTSNCEWKGQAIYFDWVLRDAKIRDIGWCYPNPNAKFADIQDYLSFYAAKADACFVDGEQVTAQEGDFYGGWITSNLEGPFKSRDDDWHWL